MKLSIATLVQGMTDQRCHPYTEDRHWYPFWRFCSVRLFNKTAVITNRPY